MVKEKYNVKSGIQKTYPKSAETFFNCDDSSLFLAVAAATTAETTAATTAATAKKGKGGKPGK